VLRLLVLRTPYREAYVSILKKPGGSTLKLVWGGLNKSLTKKFILTSHPSDVLILSISICRVVHNRTKLYGEAQMNKNQKLLNAILKSAKGRPESDDIKRLTCA